MCHFCERVPNFNQPEVRQQCFLASDRLEFGTLPRTLVKSSFYLNPIVLVAACTLGDFKFVLSSLLNQSLRMKDLKWALYKVFQGSFWLYNCFTTNISNAKVCRVQAAGRG